MFRAWVIWFLGSLFMFYKFVVMVFPSVMTSELMSEYSLTAAEMGNFTACYFYSYLILQIPAGLLIDRWGPRRVGTTAIVICALGVFLFSISTTFYLACIARVIMGTGAAFASANCIKLIANWFPVGRYAIMMGLMMSVAMLGPVCGQAPLSSLISYLGWRHAMQILGLAAVILAAGFVLIVRNRAPHHCHVDLMPERPSLLKSLKNVLSNRQSWYLSFYSGLACAPLLSFGGLWGVPFLTQALGFSHNAAARASSLLFLGFAIGAPIFGWISEKIGKRRPAMFWGTLATTFCLSMILYVPTVPAMLIFILLFFFGFSISSFLLSFSMIKESYSTIIVGTTFGFMNAFDALFGAFSDPLIGRILDLWWSGAEAAGARVFSPVTYHIALSILIFYLVLSLVLIKLIRETYCKQSDPSAILKSGETL